MGLRERLFAIDTAILTMIINKISTKANLGLSDRLRASTASFTIPSSIRTPEHDDDYDDFDDFDLSSYNFDDCDDFDDGGGHHADYHDDTHGVF